MKAKVCIIIPVYNTEKTSLLSCFDSILKNSFQDFQIIVVDDGSTSVDTRNVLSSFNGNEKVILLSQVNSGVSSARNKAILYNKEKLKIDTITFIDSDDIIDRYFLENLYNAFLKTNSDVIVSVTHSFDSFKNANENFTVTNSVPDLEINNTIDGIKKLSKNEYPNLIMGKLYKSTLVEKCLFDENISYGEDTSFLYQIFSKAKKSAFIHYCGYSLNRIQSIQSLCRVKQITNKMVLDAIKANINVLSTFYDIKLSKNEDYVLFKKIVNNVASDAFLEMIPRFSKKTATNDQKQKYNDYLSFITTHRCIKDFEPYNKKSGAKKTMFLISVKIYIFIYRFYLKSSKKRYGVAN